MFDEVKNETLISRNKNIVNKCTLRFVVLRVIRVFFKYLKLGSKFRIN